VGRDGREAKQVSVGSRGRVQETVRESTAERVRSLVSLGLVPQSAVRSCPSPDARSSTLCRWEFAKNSSLLLPDEYDRIHLDLAPFWALPRAEMRKRVREAMDLKETFVLVVENGTVSVELLDEGGLDWAGTLPRAKDAASLIRPFAGYMPDMRAVFSIHDQPQIYLSATRKASLIELGLRGEHTAHLHESDSSDIHWERSCSRESNLRTRNKNEVDQAGSLVYDTREASDICKNPYLMDLHGFTVEKRGPASHPKPRTSLIPLFGLAKTSINSDILVTPLDQFADAPGYDPDWKAKRSKRIAWRGSTTGISWMDQDTPWRKSHRFRLHDYAGNQSDARVSFVVPDIGTEGGPLRLRRETGAARDISEFFYDMKLAGEPLQCNSTDGTCDEIA
jgi:beta-1,2-xylosyltransferase